MPEYSKVTIEELRLTPVKSLRSNGNVDALKVDSDGLFNDREYMVVEMAKHHNVFHEKGSLAQPGQFLSQREDPLLATIIPSIEPEGLMLGSESHDTIAVPKAEDTASNHLPVSTFDWCGEAVDQGDEAAEWLESIIGRAVRLVAVSREKPRYAENDPALGRVGFADGYPITIASTQSFALLNKQLQKLGKGGVPNDRARSTLVLSGLVLPDCDIPADSFPEDYLKTVSIAYEGMTLVLKRRKACTRCPILDTDQLTGKREGRPLLTALNRLGRHGYHLDRERYGSKAGVFFSQNFVLELPKYLSTDATITIARGSEVTVEYGNWTNWTRST